MNRLNNTPSTQFVHSHIYAGQVRHRRFLPKHHHFSYKLYMLALDIDELIKYQSPSKLFGFSWFYPIRFVAADYLQTLVKKNESLNKIKSQNSDLSALKKRISDKVTELGGNWCSGRVVMLVQARCFGVYFSPANFYFCYNDNNQCQYVLAEVSNTPWNERHYYLIHLLSDSALISDKSFHVSPFMDMNMAYHWTIKPIELHKKNEMYNRANNNLLIHIENRELSDAKAKLFDATLQMKCQPFTAVNLLQVWLTLPLMTLKIFGGIYWQALKLFIKGIPFIPYLKKDKTN